MVSAGGFEASCSDTSVSQLHCDLEAAAASTRLSDHDQPAGSADQADVVDMPFVCMNWTRRRLIGHLTKEATFSFRDWKDFLAEPVFCS